MLQRLENAAGWRFPVGPRHRGRIPHSPGPWFPATGVRGGLGEKFMDVRRLAVLASAAAFAFSTPLYSQTDDVVQVLATRFPDDARSSC